MTEICDIQKECRKEVNAKLENCVESDDMKSWLMWSVGILVTVIIASVGGAYVVSARGIEKREDAIKENTGAINENRIQRVEQYTQLKTTGDFTRVTVDEILKEIRRMNRKLDRDSDSH